MAARAFMDTAQGLILQGSNSTVLVNGMPAAVLLSKVVSHGPCPSVHCGAPFIVGCSNTVFFEGMPACTIGDVATCGHTCTSSNNVFIGG